MIVIVKLLFVFLLYDHGDYKLRISACPRCGSRKIFQGRLKDGVLTGYSDRYVCRDCGYQGSPVIFDSIVEYDKFHMDKKSGKKLGDMVDNQLLDYEAHLSGKDKEVVGFLKDLDYYSVSETRNKSSIRSIIFMFSVVLIFSLIITLFYIPFNFFLPAVFMVFLLFIFLYFGFRIRKCK